MLTKTHTTFLNTTDRLGWVLTVLLCAAILATGAIVASQASTTKTPAANATSPSISQSVGESGGTLVVNGSGGSLLPSNDD